MNPAETKLLAPAASGERSAAIVRASPPMVLRCLLVSKNDKNLGHIQKTADRQHWNAVAHSLVGDAIREAVRTKFQLAFVDTQSATGDEQSAYEQLASDLARGHVPLIVISGDAGDPMAEIRARQLGVWLYLPGFDESTQLDTVFREARVANEKVMRQAAAVDPRGSMHGGARPSSANSW